MLSVFLVGAVALVVILLLRETNEESPMSDIMYGPIIIKVPEKKTEEKDEEIKKFVPIRKRAPKPAAEELKTGNGLRIPGSVSGTVSKGSEELDSVTIEVGDGVSGQRFSIRVPKGMGTHLMSKKLDIIIAVRDEK